MVKFSKLNASTNKQVASTPVKQVGEEVATQPTDLLAAQPLNSPTDRLDDSLLIDAIKQSIREPGHRTGNHMLSDLEKDVIDDLVHQLKKQGFRFVSGNLILRILINAHKQEADRVGEETVVHQVIRSM
jgi:hypothetical protein